MGHWSQVCKDIALQGLPKEGNPLHAPATMSVDFVKEEYLALSCRWRSLPLPFQLLFSSVVELLVCTPTPVKPSEQSLWASLVELVQVQVQPHPLNHGCSLALV
ncbi:unnamed protein product [Arctogadus glacialis]